MRTDGSPAKQVRASATYNMVVEGMLAQTGYHIFYNVLDKRNIGPGLREGVRLIKQDEARHMAYGMAHLKYAVEQRGPDYALGLQRLMGGVERDLASEMMDPVLWEALAIIFGGGVRDIVAGMEVVKDLQQRYIEQYLARMKWIGWVKPRTI